jgi:hypothetical protein
MTVTRRSVLQGVLIAAAAGAGEAWAATPVSLVVYDGRLPQSRVWSDRYASPSIDVAHEHAHLWRNLRAAQPSGRIVGLTSWSDLVLVRTLLAERGKRVRTEARCGRLMYWEMV